MFLFKYFAASFRPSRILKLRYEKFWKVFIFFLLMSLISLFPYNYKNYTSGGWKIGIIDGKIDSGIFTKLPDFITISKSGLNFEIEKDHIFQSHNKSDDEVLFIFTPKSDIKYIESLLSNYTNPNLTKRLVYTPKSIYYYNNSNNYIKSDYTGFVKEISFREIITTTSNTNKNDLVKLFVSQTSESFFGYFVVYSIVVFSITQLGMHMILFLILAGLMLLLKYRFHNFMTYIQCLKVLVFTMTIPTVISFVVGFFTHGFGPVIFQFGVGILALIVSVKYSNQLNDIDIKPKETNLE